MRKELAASLESKNDHSPVQQPLGHFHTTRNALTPRTATLDRKGNSRMDMSRSAGAAAVRVLVGTGRVLCWLAGCVLLLVGCVTTQPRQPGQEVFVSPKGQNYEQAASLHSDVLKTAAQPGGLLQITPVEDKVYEARPGGRLDAALRCKVLDPSFNNAKASILSYYITDDGHAMQYTAAQCDNSNFGCGWVNGSEPGSFDAKATTIIAGDISPGQTGRIFVCVVGGTNPFEGYGPVLSNILVLHVRIVDK